MNMEAHNDFGNVAGQPSTPWQHHSKLSMQIDESTVAKSEQSYLPKLSYA